jgi:16S rRNA (cytosine967-C5)-methyltransferase
MTPRPPASDALSRTLQPSPAAKTGQNKAKAAPTPKTDARRIALAVLDRLDEGRLTLDIILEDLNRSFLLKARDRSLSHGIIFGVLRWRNHLDWIIQHYSKTPLSRLSPSILNILRIGLYQIIYLDRIPLSAAVHTAVEMTKSRAAPWVTRYVNALLRNAACSHDQVPLPAYSEDPVKALAVHKSFPPWLLKRWLQRFGLAETQALCDAVNRIPPITLRTNTMAITRAALIQALSKDAAKVSPTPLSSWGIHLIKPQVPIDQMSAYQQGWFQVQDEAAQLMTCLLDPQPGEIILDACAGLGGKTGHMAQLMANRGQIVALDRNRQKLGQLQKEMVRLGLKIVQPKVMDLDRAPTADEFPFFDRILLDAPCSGLGVLRRNPDSKWFVSENKITQSADRQLRLLKNLSPLLKPSGILLYTVCSGEPEENELVINAFLKNHTKFAMDETLGVSADWIQAARSADGFYRTYPHRHDMDGFFAAVLRRVG